MSARNRQIVMLVVLLVAFVWLIGRQLVPGLGGGPGTPARRAGGGETRGAAGTVVEVAELHLEPLEHRPATYKPGRDPFRFAPKPPPKPPPPRPEPPPRRQPARERQRQPARPPQPPVPQPPPVQFTYLGSFGVPGKEIAVFSDGKEILNAFAGDVLQEEFVVRAIGYESADIGFVNFPDAPTKRLAVGG